MELQFRWNRKLPTPEEIKSEFPLRADLKEKKAQRDQEIEKIFTGKDDRLILIIGPCSADREDAVLEYIHRLCPVQEKVKDKLLLVSGWPMKYWWTLVAVGVAVCIGAGYALSVSGNWRWQRLVAFIDPEHDSTGSGFQIINSKISVGSGGTNGVGMFSEGTLTHLNFVPENHTDFIFSSIGETMGFAGAMILLALYAFLIYRMLILSYHTSDRFGRLVIIGVASMMIFHVFENIGINIGVMPITGIPLPFVSYGGSNLIANMAGIGLVLNVTKNKPLSRSLE